MGVLKQFLACFQDSAVFPGVRMREHISAAVSLLASSQLDLNGDSQSNMPEMNRTPRQKFSALRCEQKAP